MKSILRSITGRVTLLAPISLIKPPVTGGHRLFFLLETTGGIVNNQWAVKTPL